MMLYGNRATQSSNRTGIVFGLVFVMAVLIFNCVGADKVRFETYQESWLPSEYHVFTMFGINESDKPN
jgi:hypothetical protein